MLALFVPTLGLELAPPSSVVVVGGSSGMGKALATSVVQRGGRVLLASRSASKLKAAATEILTETGCVDVTAVATYVVDASDESQVAALADSLPLHEWDGLVVSAAGSAPHGPITTLPTADTSARSTGSTRAAAIWERCSTSGRRRRRARRQRGRICGSGWIRAFTCDEV